MTQTLQPGRAGSTTTARASVTVSVTFHGLPPGQVTTLTLATPSTATVLSRAAASAVPDGTATITLTDDHLTAALPVTVTATAPGQYCRAVLTPARTQPSLTCHPR